MPAFRVATSMGVTVSLLLLVTNVVLPSEVIAIPNGNVLTWIGVPAFLDSTLIGVTVEVASKKLPPLTTNVVLPSGVIATAIGPVPTGIGALGFLLATLIGVTVLLLPFVTKAVLPSGVIARPRGPVPTGIGVPAFLDASQLASRCCRPGS